MGGGGRGYQRRLDQRKWGNGWSCGAISTTEPQISAKLKFPDANDCRAAKGRDENLGNEKLIGDKKLYWKMWRALITWILRLKLGYIQAECKSMLIFKELQKTEEKNLAYGRHRISRPMQIVASPPRIF